MSFRIEHFVADLDVDSVHRRALGSRVVRRQADHAGVVDPDGYYVHVTHT